MVAGNAMLFVVLQFASRFLNSFLVTAARYELLEVGSVQNFANAQVATSIGRMFLSQVAGLLTDSIPLKRLYVGVEGCNVIVAALLLAPVGSAPTRLFAVNVGLGLVFAFSQPVTKSMPPAVAQADDLAIVNSWDLTCDKVARYLAPIVYTVVSSLLSFRSAVCLAIVLYMVATLLRAMVTVGERPVPSSKDQDLKKSSPLSRITGVFRKLWDGVLSLRSDRTLGLLILNTMVTNIFIYPLSSVLFPVIFKNVPQESTEVQSFFSKMLARLMEALSIKKSKAWQNYTALVSFGGVFGPMLSSVITYHLEAYFKKTPTLRTWMGVNTGIAGQMFAGLLLALVLSCCTTMDTGLLVLALFVCWVITLAVNNVYTTYFNSFQQQQLSRDIRGRFIANIMTLFTLGNSIGTMLFGRVLDGSDAQQAARGAMALLMAGLGLKVALLVALHMGGKARDGMELLARTADAGSSKENKASTEKSSSKTVTEMSSPNKKGSSKDKTSEKDKKSN